MATAEFYRLVLRCGDAENASEHTSAAVDRLLRIPGVVDCGQGSYEFGKADAAGVMALRFGDESIDIEIPRAWVSERGPRVFALVFMLAEWLRWEVYDPQIEETLKKEVVLQGMVAMRQAQRERELRGDRPNGPSEES